MSCNYIEKQAQRFCSEKCRKQYNRRKNPLKMVKAVKTIIGIIGLVILLGAAKSSDLGNISLVQAMGKCAVGLVCLAIAVLGSIWR